MAMNPSPKSSRKVVLVGNPNVGKSIIFRILTGSYVMVSNFPGTTVEVSRGRMQLGGNIYEVVDTPGINSLVPQSEDERVTCEILLREKPDVIVQVADAKNLRRTLLITSQLVEFGIPMVLALNMIDEAEDRGIDVDSRGLSELFSIPAIKTIAIYSKGRKQLLNAIQNAHPPCNPIQALYSRESIVKALDNPAPPALLCIEWLAGKNDDLIHTLEGCMGAAAFTRLKEWREHYWSAGHNYPAREVSGLRNRFLDRSVARYKKKKKSRSLKESGNVKKVWFGLLLAGLLFFAWNEFGGLLRIPTPYDLAMRQAGKSLNAFAAQANPGGDLFRDIVLGLNKDGNFEFGLLPEAVHLLFFIVPVIVPLAVLLSRSRSFAREMGELSRRPSTGIPILLGVLLLLYEFVGYTGAQTLVGLLENAFFEQHFIPWLRALIPEGFLWNLLVGEYGLISMGITYAVGIVLPVVGAFFIAFGLLEDSGYLPRLSILSDRLMRVMGLNGKAILPMVLGFGCVTMATMSTRILSSKRERLITTLLLSLGIPCSAQLGVIMGIAAGFTVKATLVIIGVVASQLLLVGYLSSLLIRGQPSEFIFEIPPIRMPQMKNVVLKTMYRIKWYLKEAVPLFLAGTLVLFFMDSVRIHGQSLLVSFQKGLEPVLSGLLHLPTEAAGIFLLGFLRRDYGAAGLYELSRDGMLTGQQVVVSLIVITLFVPCIATFLMIIKEQGWKKALAIAGFIVPFAVSVGTVVGWILRTFDIQFN
ncbi:MAG: ferrous iron transporter B [Acidobacteria bacterium]|nr:ferrous iron transporter B [Acidobacteriota bacterium]